MNDLPEPAIASPNIPMPRPQAIDDGRFWPIARPVGPGARRVPAAGSASGSASGADVASGERLDADDEQHDRDDRDGDERDPVELAGERDVVGRPAEPGEVRQRRQRRDRRLVAVDDEAAEHDRARDTRRRAPADERREGERDGARGDRRAGTARWRSRAADSVEISSPGRPLTELADDEQPDEDTTTAAIAWPVRWREQLLERDPAARRSRVAATNSMLPRRASTASVPDRARIAQRLTMIGKNEPYLYWR